MVKDTERNLDVQDSEMLRMMAEHVANGGKIIIGDFKPREIGSRFKLGSVYLEVLRNSTYEENKREMSKTITPEQREAALGLAGQEGALFYEVMLVD